MFHHVYLVDINILHDEDWIEEYQLYLDYDYEELYVNYYHQTNEQKQNDKIFRNNLDHIEIILLDQRMII